MELMYAVGETAAGKKRSNEAHYEHRYDDGKKGHFYWNASDVRTRTWQTVLSGAAGLTYGADNVMQMYDPSIAAQDGSGPPSPWYVDSQLPGAAQMQYIAKAIFDRHSSTYFSRIPAQDIIVGDAGTDDMRVTAARDSKESWIMVYTPTGKPFSIKTDTLSGRQVQANWFDPTNGSYTPFKYPMSSPNAAVMFTPPSASDHSDWLLVLETEQGGSNHKC